MKIQPIKEYRYGKIINRFEHSNKPKPEPSKFMLRPKSDNRQSKFLSWC